MTCSTDTIQRTHTVDVPPTDKATVTLRAETGGSVWITRLLLAANGAGFAGLDGLIISSARIGNRYLFGGPITAGLRGAAVPEVTAEAFVKLFARYKLRQPLMLGPNEDLVLHVRNTTGVTRRLTAADDRQGVMQTALWDPERRFARPVDPSVLLATAAVPASADRFVIEIPREAGLQGTLQTYALTASPGVRIEIAVGKHVQVDAGYPALHELLFEHGFGLAGAIRVGRSEALHLVVSNDLPTVGTVSFAAELVPESSAAAPTVQRDIAYAE